MSKRHRRRAFSLVELLVVIAIIAALGMMLAPVTMGLMRAYQLTTSANTVASQLNLARQAALTNGYAVQVRLYKLPDYNQPETTGSPAVYRGIQCFSEGAPAVSGGTTTTPTAPLTPPQFFTSPVVVLEDAAKSTLLTLPSTVPVDKLSTYGANYRYLSFRFKPDGQADLPDTATGLTMVLKGDAIESGGLPANFCSIVLDPRTGAVRGYRP
jgi:uncharacterized protein (TIGR02596 family)